MGGMFVKPACSRAQGAPLAVLCAMLFVAGCAISGVEGSDSAREGRLRYSDCPGGMIEDLEDGDNQAIKQEGRGGYWFTYSDKAGSTVSPMGAFKPAPGGVHGSKYAARFCGKVADAGQTLYVGMGLSLVDPKRPYEASKYKGISFWVKGGAEMRVMLLDQNTDPSADRCTDCYNHFGVNFYAPEEWTRFTIPFDKMTQKEGWGDQLAGVSSKALIGIQFEYKTPGREYDIWVDDIAFVGCE